MMRGFLMKQNTVQKQPKIVPMDTAAVRMDILIQPKSTTKSINSCQTLPELIILPLLCPRAAEVVLLTCLFGLIGLGLFPEPILFIAGEATEYLFSAN